MKPKLSKAAIQLREQIDDSFPDRDRSSDGWVGDTRHAARLSDHNPDEQGWVRAIDIDADLFGAGVKPHIMPDFADQIRLACKSKAERRISYIIWDSKIASPILGWKWRKYTGINKHQHHMHVSFKKEADLLGQFYQISMIGGK
jgi:hypothetical protein